MNVLAAIAAMCSLLAHNGAAAGETWKKRFPPTQNEIFDYVDKLMAIADFRDSIVYDGESVRVRPGKAGKALLQVHDHLDRLNNLTTAFAYNFARNKLLQHCDTAVGLLNDKSLDPKAFAETFGDSFKFQHDLDDYCVFSFLCHARSELPVVNMFGLVTFLQTFSRGPNEIDRSSLTAEIRNYRKTLNVYVDNKDNVSLVWLSDKDLAKTQCGRGCQTVPQTFESLSTSRGEFKALSKALCSPSAIPIVDERVFSEKDAVPHDDGFVDYVMRKEECEVNFRPFNSLYYHQQKTIEKWNCYEILESPEYGIEEYLQATGKLIMDRYMRRRNHDLLVRFLTYKPNVNALFALPELREQLRLHHNVGADVLLYNKIAANAISMAVAKEGYKMLKAVAFTLEQTCKNEATVGAFNETRARIMSRLFALSLVHREFRDRISEKLLVDVDGYGPKLFGLIMDHYLEKYSLGSQEDGQQTMDKICQLSIAGFFSVRTDEYGNGEHETLAFHEYHFERPLVNIRRLCDFLGPRRHV